MKKIYLFLGVIFLLFGCQDVVELDLKDYQKKVVIDANLFINEEEYNAIKIYYSAPFYSTNYEYINSAIVNIQSTDGGENFLFEYDGNGLYKNQNFTPIEGKTYKLTVKIDQDVYTATSNYWVLNKDIQVDITPNAGIMGDDYEVKFSYSDEAATADYYLHELSGDLSLRNDLFTNGQMITERTFIEQEAVDAKISFAATKISKTYYEYINKIFASSANIGNPFASPIGRVNGNIVSADSKKEAPLGYFHIAKREKVEFRLQDKL